MHVHAVIVVKKIMHHFFYFEWVCYKPFRLFA